MYPFKLGHQMKEMEIVFTDISKSDEDGKNSRELFTQPLNSFNFDDAKKSSD